MQLHETDKTSSYWRHQYQLCPLIAERCTINTIDHSPYGLSATGVTSHQQSIELTAKRGG